MKFVGRKPNLFSEGSEARLEEWLTTLDIYFRAVKLLEYERSLTLVSFLDVKTLMKVTRARLLETYPVFEDF